MDNANRKKDYSDLISQFIEEQYTQEQVADLSTFAVLDKQHLSIVEHEIMLKNGHWIVYLLFTHVEHPYSFVRVPMKTCQTRKLAEITGNYLRRAYSLDSALAFTAQGGELNCNLN